MGSIVQSKAVTITQSTIDLGTSRKVFTAQHAALCTCDQRQWTAHSHGVAKFPGLICEILFRDHVFRNVPALHVARQNQLQLGFPFLFMAIIALKKSFAHIVSNYLEQRFIGAIDILEFHVQHRINPMLAEQWAKSVFPPESGKQRTLVRG